MSNKRNPVKMIPVIVAVLALVLTSTLTVSAKVGTFVFDWQATAAANSSVHILATSDNDLTFDKVYDVSGLTSSEAAFMVYEDLQNMGWYVSWNSADQVEVLRRIAGSSLKEFGTHYFNNTQQESPLIGTYLRATSEMSNEVSNFGSFTFTFSDPIVNASLPAYVKCNLTTEADGAILHPGYTIADVYAGLESVVQNQGYATSAAEGMVELEWDDPQNYALLGNQVSIEVGVLGGAGGPHLTLGLAGQTYVSDYGIALHPVSTTTFPAQGGLLKYHLAVGNDADVQFIAGTWVEITAMKNEIAPFYDTSITPYSVNPTGSISGDWFIEIPSYLPPDLYTVKVYLAMYSTETPEIEVLAYEMFQFQKMGAISEIQNPVPNTESTEPAYDPQAMEVPRTTTLLQASPNPFNPETNLTFYMAQNGQVSMVVYDVSGREVATLLNGYYQEGQHQARFDARALPSGVYFARLSTPDQVQMQKLLLVK